jgi:hypothetical protein
MSVTGDALGTALATAMLGTPVPAAQLTAWKAFGNSFCAVLKDFNPTAGVLMQSNADGFPVPSSGGGTGHTVLSGSGAPGVGVGVDGDFYIDYTNWDIYGPKAGGAWPTGVSIIGPQCDPGVDGDSLNPRGAWDVGTSYVVLDVVSHEGSSYVAIYNTLGSEPPSANWLLLAEKGDKGDQGDPGTAADIAAETHAATSLTPPDATDEIPAVREILGVWTLIKFTWANIAAQFAAAAHTHPHNATVETIAVGTTAPATPQTNDLWIDTN